MDVSNAFFGSSDVSVDGDLHSNVSADDGSESTNEESNGSVGGPWSHFNGEEEKDGKKDQENSQEDVLLFEESNSSLISIK